LIYFAHLAQESAHCIDARQGVDDGRSFCVPSPFEPTG